MQSKHLSILDLGAHPYVAVAAIWLLCWHSEPGIETATVCSCLKLPGAVQSASISFQLIEQNLSWVHWNRGGEPPGCAEEVVMGNALGPSLGESCGADVGRTRLATCLIPSCEQVLPLIQIDYLIVHSNSPVMKFCLALCLLQESQLAAACQAQMTRVLLSSKACWFQRVLFTEALPARFPYSVPGGKCAQTPSAAVEEDEAWEVQK